MIVVLINFHQTSYRIYILLIDRSYIYKMLFLVFLCTVLDMDSQGYLSNAHSIIGGFLVFLCTVIDMDSQGYLSIDHR